MEKVTFNRFHTYSEITAMLEGWAAAYPGLTRLSSAGTSPEGRQQWVLELTNHATGAAEDKPAYFINGNTHAGEVSGSAACLYTIQQLLFGYGQDELCTRVLDTRTIYVMPRITMDGSEYYLTTPNTLRSAARPYPETELTDGLHPQDIDNDGLILQMRLPDPHGDWKVSDLDPRLMIKRAPDDFGGQYYRLLPEGLIHNFDGVEIKLAKPQHGLDFNRNFAANWAPEHRQRGAGSYPFSEPETKAVADFMLSNKNIGGALGYHTAVGVFLRPFEHLSDDKMPKTDLELYKTLGYVGTDETGFPMVSIFHDLTTDQSQPTVGSFPDWAYGHLGILGMEVELWDLPKRAGIPSRSFKALLNRTPREIEADELKILQWNDQELAGAGFVNWHTFAHPQLGQVELGGWKIKQVRQNPPLHLLEEEIRGSAMYTIKHAAASPLMQIEKLTAERVEGDLHHLHLVVVNSGYLATNLTEMAIRQKVAKPVEVKIELGAGLTLQGGQAKTELGHIAGFGKKQADWVVSGSGQVTITVWSEKGGVVRRIIEL